MRLEWNGKRTIAGCLAGALLALVSPWLLMTELFASLPIVLLPALGITAIHRWAGRIASGISGFMVMLSFGWFTGSVFMWAIFLLMLNPLLMLLRLGEKPFFEQLRSAIMGFGLGLLMAVLMFYLGYGGGLVEKLMQLVPQLLRDMPAEAIEAALSAMPANAGMPGDAAGFVEFVDGFFAQLTSGFGLLLPGRLFSGALLTAVFCTLLSNRMQKKAGLTKPGCYVPMARWYLPASATCGLSLIVLAGYVLMLSEVQGGDAVFYTAYEIAVWAFVIQALASVSRHLDGMLPGHGVKIGLLCLMLAIALFGAAPYIGVCGFVSAVMGSGGALRQFQQRKTNRQSDHDNKSDPDSGND